MNNKTIILCLLAAAVLCLCPSGAFAMEKDAYPLDTEISEDIIEEEEASPSDERSAVDEQSVMEEQPSLEEQSPASAAEEAELSDGQSIVLTTDKLAFAENISGSSESGAEGTQVLTVNTPALTWTLEIPASLEIPFQKTDRISMGQVRLTDVSWDSFPDGNGVYVLADFDKRLTSETNDSDYLEYELYQINHSHLPNGHEGTTDLIEVDQRPLAYQVSKTLYAWADLYIQIPSSNWQNAAPGTRYTGTITYASQYGRMP